jgi:Phage integrase family
MYGDIHHSKVPSATRMYSTESKVEEDTMDTNADDNSYTDAMKRYVDMTKINFGYCRHPFDYQPCPHHPGPSYPFLPRKYHPSDRKEEGKRDRSGLYSGQRSNRLPLHDYHGMHDPTALEHLDGYFRERLQLDALDEATMALIDVYGGFEEKAGNMTDNLGEHTPSEPAAGNTSQAEHDQEKHPPFWLPTDDQWQTFIQTARHEPLRNQVMIFLAYAAALRSNELRLLRIGDIDLTRRTVSVREETTKTRQARAVVYPESIHHMIGTYVTQRYETAQEHNPLFPSEPNSDRPISHTRWSEIVKQLARQVGTPQFSTHTLRRKRIAEMWDLHRRSPASEEASQ